MVGKTEEGDEVWMATTEELLEEDEIWINTKTSNSIEFHLLHNVKKDDFLLMEQIPEEYHEFIRVFDEKEANQFPESWVWDHEIELKEGFQPKSFKTYNLTPKEQKELDAFLKENLKKGYIRPSKSPMATPFFFVKKKRRKAVTMPRLPVFERVDDKERIPSPIDFWADGQNQRWKILH